MNKRHILAQRGVSVASGAGAGRRWYPIALVTVAIAISYFDRQTLPVAIAAIQRSISISEQQFSYLQTAFLLSYAALYAGGGRLLDLIGTRRGFTIIMLWWSAACGLHGLASGFGLLLASRFLLGMGEGGAFPAAVRVVAEWIPAEKRSTAVGIINAGTAVGSVAAPPLIGFILLRSGWRAVFVVAAAIGVAWVLLWVLTYRSDNSDLSAKTIDLRLIARRMTLREMLGIRNVQALVFAKFMSDSAWYFLLFWLPKYLYDARHFDIKHVSYFAWIPYAASGLGSLIGGIFSTHLLQGGHSLDRSRKLALGASAALMPVVILVPVVPINVALLLFSIAFFCQQSWSGLIMTVPADIFPLSVVGSVSGLVGFAGAIGGAVFGLIAGYLLQNGFGYGTLFTLVGSFHLIGFAAIALFGGKIQPLGSTEMEQIETHP